MALEALEHLPRPDEAYRECNDCGGGFQTEAM
jgi:hypothetical protein